MSVEPCWKKLNRISLEWLPALLWFTPFKHYDNWLIDLESRPVQLVWTHQWLIPTVSLIALLLKSYLNVSSKQEQTHCLASAMVDISHMHFKSAKKWLRQWYYAAYANDMQVWLMEVSVLTFANVTYSCLNTFKNISDHFILCPCWFYHSDTLFATLMNHWFNSGFRFWS